MAEPLAVCLVSTFYPPESFGGDGVVVRRLAEGLRARGHHVRVLHNPAAHRLLGGHPGTETRDEAARNVPAGAGAGLATAATYLTGRPLGYRGQLAGFTGAADVVHFHNPSLLGGPGVLTTGGPDAVRLYTTHEHWLLCPMHVLFRNGKEVCTKRTCVRCSLAHHRPPQPWRATGLLRRSLRALDTVLAPSDYTAALHREAFPEVTVQVHRQPGPDRADVAAALAAPAPNRARPYVLYAGRLEPVKGVLGLVRAFGAARGVDLLVAGDGSQRAAVEDAARSVPAVAVLGARPRPEVLALARHARALVVPSAGLETAGGVAVEAMSLGTPVVVRDLGPLPELVAGGGGLTAATDEGLVAALRRLVDEPALRADASARALRTVEDTYSEAGYFREWFEQVAVAAERRGLAGTAGRAGAAALAEAAP